LVKRLSNADSAGVSTLRVRAGDAEAWPTGGTRATGR
jgi:hypothetical protein